VKAGPSFADFLYALERDRSRGASELARHCLDRAARSALEEPASDAAGLRRLLLDQARQMERSRPSMAPVRNLVECWEQDLGRLPATALADFRQAAAHAAEEIARRSRQAVAEAAAAAVAVLGNHATLITHSYSSTVVEVLHLLRGSRTRVLVSESRPLCEGRSLAAEGARLGLEVTLITDAQMGVFAGGADLALVGADSLLADGSAVNKAGSYLLALAARDQGIPFYVCCESFKRLSDAAAEPELEEKEAAELGWEAPPGVAVRNVYFDRTPAPLISGWISEAGLTTRWGCPEGCG